MRLRLSSATLRSELVHRVEEASGQDLMACNQCGKWANGQVITVYLHRMGFRLGREHFTATIGFSEELGIVSTCSGDTASSISSCSALMTTSTCFM